jgi:hypothetical protein
MAGIDEHVKAIGIHKSTTQQLSSTIASAVLTLNLGTSMYGSSSV